MTQSSGASPEEPARALTQDERLAAAAQFRRFGYLLLAVGAIMGIAGVVAWANTANPVFLFFLVAAVFDVFFALRQFASARNV